MPLINIDMKHVAERILNDYSGAIQPNGDPILITHGTRLHRFGIVAGGELVVPDKLHILVDAGVDSRPLEIRTLQQFRSATVICASFQLVLSLMLVPTLTYILRLTESGTTVMRQGLLVFRISG